MGDCDVADGVVVAAAYGADGESVAAGAGTTREDDILEDNEMSITLYRYKKNVC